jgi:hypothetical protein
MLAAGLAVGLLIGASQWAIAQQSIRLFGTTSTGTSRAVLVSAAGNMMVSAGASGAGQFPVLLTSNTTTYTALANTNEQDMWTYSLPAATLATDGQAVRITSFGTKAANANNVTIKSYFGATQVAALSFTTSGASWRTEAIVLRTGAATQLGGGDVEVGLGSVNVTVATPAATLSGAVTIKVTGQSATGTAADYVFRGATVEFLK